jgi:hypothetical protein
MPILHGELNLVLDCTFFPSLHSFTCRFVNAIFLFLLITFRVLLVFAEHTCISGHFLDVSASAMNINAIAPAISSPNQRKDVIPYAEVVKRFRSLLFHMRSKNNLAIKPDLWSQPVITYQNEDRWPENLRTIANENHLQIAQFVQQAVIKVSLRSMRRARLILPH